MKKVYLFLCLITSYYSSHAQAGSLDPSFGVNGIQTTGIKTNLLNETGQKILHLSDGALLVVFNISNYNGRAVIGKYLPTGAIDPSFGDHGYTTPSDMLATSAALQQDGKIVMIGFRANNIVVARYNGDGSVDKTFGSTGSTTINIGGSSFPKAIAVQNGNIYIVGNRLIKPDRFTENRDIFICRLSPDGSFASNTADYTTNDQANALVIVGDKVVVAGFTGSKFALLSFNVDLSVDKSFGVNGLSTTEFIYYSSQATSIVIQANKLVAAGHSNGDIVVARYNIDGSLDNTFSDDGKAITSLHAYTGNAEVVTDEGGKIITAGSTYGGFALERLNNDGSTDNTFGKNGIINYSMPSGVASFDITRENIFVAGTNFSSPTSDYTIGNFNLDGSLNTSFSNVGWLQDFYPSSYIYFTKAITQKDGKIVVVGYTGQDFLVVRYNSNGSLDKTFGQNGVVTTSFSETLISAASTVFLQDDKILVAGNSSTINNDKVSFAVARYNPDGSLDNSFGVGGKVLTDFGSNLLSRVKSAAINPMGDKIIVAGYNVSIYTSKSSFAIACYNLDGSLDKTFDDDGLQTTNFSANSFDVANEVAVQGEKVVVFGSSDGNLVIARYNANGSLDNTFGTNGKLVPNFSANTSIYKSTFKLQGEKIIVVGYGSFNDRNGLIYLRYNGDGSIDNDFPANGKVVSNFPANAYGNVDRIYIQNNDKVVMAGNMNSPSDHRFIIARYNPDNSPDTSFGENGIQTTLTENETFRFLADITVFDKRLYAIGYAEKDYRTDGIIAAFKLEEPGACTATGSILREFWANVTGTLISDIPVTTTPSSTSQLNSFEAPTDIADNYAQRIRGYICAPATGNYTFYISGDDESELWLSTSDNPADKRKIASVGGMQWTNPREWTKFKSQKSVTIFLQANTKYYIEALNKEGAGGDNLAVGWITPGSTDIDVIPGKVLSPFAGTTTTPPLVCTASGTILREYWANVTGTLISDIPVTTTPSSTSQLNSFEAPTDIADNYAQRIRGYICAPATGNYTFYISGDDESELWLSTSDNPADKRKIASVGGMQWTNPREWTKFDSQKSVTIFLQANTKYYIEALNKEGAGGDNLAVGWITPGSADIEVIPGRVLSPFTGTTTTPPVVCTATGTILREYWANVTGTLISDIPVNATPSSTSQLNNFEAPTDIADNYAQRIRGYICAPTTGNYTFYISGDDESELWLSTSDNPADKRKIASVGGMQWTNPREWTKYESQKSVTIFLQANTKYYIEALNKEGAGGDNLAVGWITPGTSDIAVIPGGVLSPFTGTNNPPVVCTATGTILREYWANVPGTLISDIPVNATPSSTSQLNNFEAPTDIADNYAQRIRGYICAPTTGNYTFYISGDDESEFWLSNSDNPADKRKIATVGGMQWTNPREWTKFESQKSVTIFLQANSKYYIEALNKEGAGGDNLAVGWITPGTTDIEVIPGRVLSPFTGTNSQPLFVAVESQKITGSFSDKPGLSLRALPNPTITHFTINLQSGKSEPVDLKVLDAVGRVIETKRKVSPNGSVTIGSSYHTGTYFLQAVQGSERVTLKLIKGAF